MLIYIRNVVHKAKDLTASSTVTVQHGHALKHCHSKNIQPM